MNTSHPQFKQMMTLFNQTGKMGYRHTYAFEVSNERTESTRELTEPEVLAIIERLKKLLPDANQFTPPPGDEQRKKMIGLAKDMRWTDPVNDLKKWVLKQKYKKPLMDHSPDELNVLVSILENQVKPSFYKGYNNQ